jgi:ResB-like family
MGVVQIPGATAALQLQLGYTCRPLPVSLLLKNFEMVPYSGGMATSNTMFRDFKSTLELTDGDGHVETDETSLNSPIYYDHGNWIFFQAGYDPDGQSSTIGVGNRPGVVVMLSGCVMIVLGLLYAFYVKPVVIRRMKAKAMERAGRKKAEMVV